MPENHFASFARNLVTCSLLLLSSGCVYAATSVDVNRPVKPEDFAYGMSLVVSGDDALYQITLPLEVYKNTVRSDLGDMRVFNAHGEIVPHMLQQPAHNVSKLPLQTLAYFPLHSTHKESLDQLTINVKTGTSGAVLDIVGTPADGAGQLSGYLLDTSNLTQAMQALELVWPVTKENFVGVIKIEFSDDLKNWHLLVQDAPLANLQYANHFLLQNRIDFPPLHAKYLRLSWPDSQTEFKFIDIKTELAAEKIAAPVTWMKIQGSATGRAGEYVFDLGAQVPLQRMRFELPQNNTLVNAVLLSRAQVTDAWQVVSKELLYALQRNNQQLNNPDIVLSSRHRYWMLRVDQNSGGLGAGVPVMNLGWLPQQLVFVARGEAPFQIAFGSRHVKPAASNMQAVMLSSGDTESGIATAQMGPVVSLGGHMRLEPEPPALPWKTWLLWLFLSLAVLVLGWMAYRLIQQMNTADSNNDTHKTE